MAIKINQMVEMFYELKIENEIIDSNVEKEPITFSYGSGQIISGLESRIIDMNEGETRTIKVPANEAYGEYDETLTQIAPIEDFEGINLEIGMTLEGEDENNEILRATVIDVTKEDVTVDYNHPLAGCELEFKVIIKSII
ncbi:peptidylprolyl isomerase [Arcobacter sp. s6]|jgi:FKBP-type peptidyl-prolyl cis-trans isomerase SlyD|uniref:peptidylprolyl isomerase n=1 Tax=Arcobacter sp. s6 TaxID=3230363 RepID=UPI0034A090BB